MDPLDTTSEFIMVEVDKPPFGKQRKRQPNPYYISRESSSSFSTPINVNNSRLDAFKALEEKQKRKNDEMIANLKPDSSGFGSNYGGKKSRKSKRSRRSRKSKRSRRSRRSKR